MTDELFKTELRKLCMELDLDLGESGTSTPFGTINCLSGCELYKYYLTKKKVPSNEFIEEVEKYEIEYHANKKDVVYKK